jgi:hypothetical protein
MTPWTGDQPVLNTGQHKYRINAYTHQTSILWVGFEPTIPASEREKTVHASDCEVTVTGSLLRLNFLPEYFHLLISLTTWPFPVGYHPSPLFSQLVASPSTHCLMWGLFKIYQDASWSLALKMLIARLDETFKNLQYLTCLRPAQ